MPPIASAKPQPDARHFRWFYLGLALFFVASWLYVLLHIEPAIALHGASPAFFSGPAFRSTFLSKPGGWAEYAAAFLSRCDTLPLLGSAVQAGLATALVLLSRLVWRALAGRAPGSAAFVSGLLALLLRELWEYSAYYPSLAILLALASSLSFPFARTLPAGIRILFFWVTGTLLFLIGGPIAAILAASLAALFEAGARKNWPVALACLAPLLLPFAWAFLGPEPDYWKISLPGASLIRAILATLIAWVPAISLFLLWLSGDKSATSPAEKKKSKPATRNWRHLPEPVSTVLILTVGFVALWLLLDRTRQRRLKIDYFSSRADHQNVIATALTMKPGDFDPPAELRVHRALYHTGRLGSEFFAFCSQGELELFPSLSASLESCRPQAETLYELGLINDSEHFAHEALEWEGERPEILRHLAKINCLKDRPAAARVFLTRLAQMPFEAKWPADCLRNLDLKGTLPDTIGLSEIRGRMLTRDFAHDMLLTDPLLLSLLTRNASNRMAYEFLMIHYLQGQDLKKFAAQLPRLEGFDYREIPQHFEEGLLIHQATTGTEVKFSRLRVRDSTRKRFETFSRVLDQELQLNRNPLPALHSEFRNTYWFYFTSHQSQGAVPSK